MGDFGSRTPYGLAKPFLELCCSPRLFLPNPPSLFPQGLGLRFGLKFPPSPAFSFSLLDKSLTCLELLLGGLELMRPNLSLGEN